MCAGPPGPPRPPPPPLSAPPARPGCPAASGGAAGHPPEMPPGPGPSEARRRPGLGQQGGVTRILPVPGPPGPGPGADGSRAEPRLTGGAAAGQGEGGAGRGEARGGAGVHRAGDGAEAQLLQAPAAAEHGVRLPAQVPQVPGGRGEADRAAVHVHGRVLPQRVRALPDAGLLGRGARLPSWAQAEPNRQGPAPGVLGLAYPPLPAPSEEPVRPVRGPTRLQQTDHSTSTGTRTGSSPNDRGSHAREGGRGERGDGATFASDKSELSG